MPSLIIDASVVIKWVTKKDEAGVLKARHVFEMLAREELELYAPSFLLIEVANILFKKKKVKPEKVIKSVDWMRRSGIKFVNPTLGELRDYIDLSMKCGLTMY